jgi:hypothetical protein
MLTLLPVLAVLFAPWHRRAPVAIKIDGRHYRGAPGTIEHEEQKMTPKQTNKTTADVGLSSRVNRRSRGGSRDAVAGARPPETSQGRRRQDREGRQYVTTPSDGLCSADGGLRWQGIIDAKSAEGR